MKGFNLILPTKYFFVRAAVPKITKAAISLNKIKLGKFKYLPKSKIDKVL